MIPIQYLTNGFRVENIWLSIASGSITPNNKNWFAILEDYIITKKASKSDINNFMTNKIAKFSRRAVS